MSIKIGVGITAAGVGSGTFSPDSLSGLLIWVNSANAVGSPVSQLTDLSGNANHMTQGTVANQPAFTASNAQYNNLPSLTFDGSNDELHSPSISMGTFTKFLVARGTTAGVMTYRNSAGNIEQLFGGNPAVFVTKTANTSSYNLGAAWGVTATPTTMTHAFDGTHAGHTLRINGTLQSMTTAVGNAPGTGAIAVAQLLFNDNGGFAAAGTMAEMLVYNRVLSGTEVGQVETYLRSRYAHY